MKKTITSLIIGFACATGSTFVMADDLRTVYEQAKQNDPVVLKAKANYLASQEDVVQARSRLLPSLGGSATIKHSEGDGYNDDGFIETTDTENVSYGLSLSMELYHHDTWLRMDNAKKSAHQTEVLYNTAKQELIIRVTEAYFNVLKAKDDLEFAIAEKKAIERQLEQTKERYKVGLIAVTNVHEAQAQYDNAITSEIRAENNVFNAEEALRVITNVYPKELSVLNTERFSASRPSPDTANEWQQMAEAKSLDLIAQKISVDIAKENINIARSGHYPTLDLSASYGNSKSKVESVQFDGLDSQSVGVTLTVPIYSGGAVSSSVRQAQSRYVAASQDLAQTHRNVVRSARNSYNTVIAAVSAINSLERSVVSAESALKATEAGFEVGTRTIVDVLNSTTNLYNAKRNLSSTRYDYIQSILALKRAAGTISEKDLDDINAGLKAQ